jgi:hypothetical protein
VLCFAEPPLSPMRVLDEIMAFPDLFIFPCWIASTCMLIPFSYSSCFILLDGLTGLDPPDDIRLHVKRNLAFAGMGIF